MTSPFVHETLATEERTEVAEYASYTDAQRAVDFLADQDFPVKKLDIVGRDLCVVERISGRVTALRAAVTGAGSGASIGLLFGLLWGLFATTAESFFAFLAYCLLLGLVFGALLGAVAYAFTRGRRDFTSRSAIVARRYEVLADPDLAETARAALARLS